LPAALAVAYCLASLDPPPAMNSQSPDHPQRNWPLIWTGVIVGLIVTVSVIGLLALYIANFNLFEWLE